MRLSSRSTWACELKLKSFWYIHHATCHAPRERVSWNQVQKPIENKLAVTLHVSVWVEMERFQALLRSVRVTLHVSVWVEIILKCRSKGATSSRSTWACELKWKFTVFACIINSHAPRERVSWNSNIFTIYCLSRSSRSTWACELKSYINIVLHMSTLVTLHVSVWVEIRLYRLVGLLR